MFSEDGLHTTSYSDHNMDEVDSLNSDVVTMPLPANIDSGVNELPPSIEHDDGYMRLQKRFVWKVHWTFQSQRRVQLTF